MADLGEGTYVCTLDKDTQKIAKKELFEDPKQRASQIETFREWVKSQPHFVNCRTDDLFLLRFLRGAKFSMLRAQKTLDNFLTMRSVEEKGAPEFFRDLDPADEKLSEIMALPTQVPLPGRDKKNRKVVLIRTGAQDPYSHDFVDVMRSGFISSDILQMDEMSQVHGFLILLDFSQFGMSHMSLWNVNLYRKCSRCWMDTYPSRNKGIHYYNMPTIFNAMFELGKRFMKDKMKSRLHLHWDSLESLHKEIPKEMLPEEYGGSAGPLQELTKKWKEEVMKNKAELARNAEMSVDESKRPADAAPLAKNGEAVVGSFRKLAD